MNHEFGSRRGDQTTRPTASTGAKPLPATRPALWWVFPEQACTVLTHLPQRLGRSEDCATVLRGSEASRHHAEVLLDGPIGTIRDLESRNGVYLNGNRVEFAPLGVGDVVRIGEWVAIFQCSESDAAWPSFRAIAPGWYGSNRLAAAVEHAQRAAAASNLPVVVLGETGTGKEGMCRAIHDWSARTGPFIAVNCAALPSELAEAELFGYRKGAFTGAERASVGHFRAAHQGTLLLDEVTELSLPLQAKLLRVLEERAVCPIGESHSVPVDVRVVAATQQPLDDAVAERQFRADLMARLDGYTLKLPPLRERRADIAPLFLELVKDHSGGALPMISARVIELLLLYDWPLNVRELVLLVRRLLALYAHEATWKASHLPERFQSLHLKSTASSLLGGSYAPTDDELAFDALVQALRAHGGNVSRAASVLGISRGRAYRLLEARPGFDVSALRVESNGG
jgi:transcriptional regulator with AAA-type ATPase domain